MCPRSTVGLHTEATRCRNRLGSAVSSTRVSVYVVRPRWANARRRESAAMPHGSALPNEGRRRRAAIKRPILVRVPARTAIEIPPGAGPGGRRGWHDVVYRALDVGLGRAPRARARLLWRAGPAPPLARAVVGT